MHILTSTGTVLVLRVAVEDVGRAIGGVALANSVGLKVDIAQVSNGELGAGAEKPPTQNPLVPFVKMHFPVVAPGPLLKALPRVHPLLLTEQGSAPACWGVLDA
jgi:hypothetical protein